MAIDTSIYGMIQRPKIKSPNEFQADALTLRNLGMENELRQQQIASARALEQQRVDELQRQKAFREAVGQGKTGNDLRAVDPDSAFKLEKADAETQKEKRMAESADATRQATQYETQRKRLGDLTSIISGVTDEASYMRGIRNAFEMGIIDATMAEQMASHPFNPDEVKQLGSSLMTMKERIDLQEKLDEAKRKQVEFDATIGGKAAESQGKVMTTAEREANKGLTAAQVAEQERAKAQQEFQAAENAKNRGVTMRGQDMTDARAKEANKNARGNNLPEGAINKLEQNKAVSDRLSSLEATFNDKFAGNAVIGGLENTIGKLGGESLGLTTEGQTDWWQNYQDYINTVRKDLFGSALTPTEQKEFEKAIIQPSSNPDVIRTNIARQKQIINAALARRADTYQAGGYNTSQVDLYRPQGSGASGAKPATGSRPPLSSFEKK